MRGKTKNTIGVMTKTLRLIKGQELEKGAFVTLQISLKLFWGNLRVALQWLDASIVLPYETLKLS